MENTLCKRVFSCFDETYDLLFSLESIITLTKEACLEKEVGSKHYNLPLKDKIDLSEERNHYINMLNIALDKVTNLKEINSTVEKELATSLK